MSLASTSTLLFADFVSSLYACVNSSTFPLQDNIAYPCELKPVTNEGIISPISLTILPYLEYSSDVKETFSPKEFTPFDSVSNSGVNTSSRDFVVASSFFCSLNFDVTWSTLSDNSSSVTINLSNAPNTRERTVETPIVKAILRAIVEALTNNC